MLVKTKPMLDQHERKYRLAKWEIMCTPNCQGVLDGFAFKKIKIHAVNDCLIYLVQSKVFDYIYFTM
jgi:hypothetical protein